MIETEFIYLIFLILTILQSIAGVGVLVIGTPALLSLNLNIVDVLFVLLPISIFTSLLNLIYFNLLSKKKRVNIDKNIKKIFFLICIPSIFLGLLILRNFENFLNLKYIISIVIISSILLTNKKNNLINFSTKFKLIYLFFTGMVHGITNSGGSLLSLFLSTNQDKESSRFSITFFYFFLASFQFLIFIYVFGLSEFKFSIITLTLIILAGVIIGNLLSKHFSRGNFRYLITFFSLVSVIFLLFSK